MINFQNRKVQVTDLHMDGEIITALAAYWDDTAEELTDLELDKFNEECAGDLYDEGYQRKVMQAEAMSDLAEDR